MSIFEQAESAVFLPRRSVGGFTATITLEEASTDELEITQHPVQQGASITDHAYLKPATLNLKLMWSADNAPLPEIYQNLLMLQASREPIDVITGKRAYQNMLIKSLALTTDVLTENVLNISMSLQEIFITALEVVTVPPRKDQKNPGKTGATNKAGQKSPEPKKKSALKALIG
jgi:hypothetical protein